ncbi:hypothetical protein K1I67_00770 [Streptococcus infantis]|nr:hypothetical protein [Streptococcus infantis]MBZ2111770.1 hypothetical protein [Streptococcus infantis]
MHQRFCIYLAKKDISPSRPEKNYPNYNWDDLDRFIQDVLSNPAFKVCCVDPKLYVISKDEIISECISAGYTVEEREDGILNIS